MKLHEIEFVRVMTLEYPTIREETLKRLMSLARRHHKLQEKACCEDVAENHDEKCERAIHEICKELPGCVPIFSGDPRGCTVKLKVQSGVTNDWGREGICVPQ